MKKEKSVLGMNKFYIPMSHEILENCLKGIISIYDSLFNSNTIIFETNVVFNRNIRYANETKTIIDKVN